MSKTNKIDRGDEKIRKHLKAEDSIQKNNALIDDLLNVHDRQDGLGQSTKKKPNFWIPVALLLLATLLALYLWNKGISENQIRKSPQNTNIAIEEKSIPGAKVQTEKPQEIEKKNISKDVHSTKENPATDKENDLKASNSLFAAHFEPQRWNDNSLRGESSSEFIALKNELQELYKSANYKGVLELTEPIISSLIEEFDIKFYNAQAQIFLPSRDLANAKKILEEIIAHDDNVFIEDAAWYLAGVYVLEGKSANAKSILSEHILSYPNSKYFAKAESLMKNL